jgi:hypothetical protein
MSDATINSIYDVIGNLRERMAKVETKLNWVLALVSFVAATFGGAVLMSALRSVGVIK